MKSFIISIAIVFASLFNVKSSNISNTESLPIIIYTAPIPQSHQQVPLQPTIEYTQPARQPIYSFNTQPLYPNIPIQPKQTPMQLIPDIFWQSYNSVLKENERLRTQMTMESKYQQELLQANMSLQQENLTLNEMLQESDDFNCYIYNSWYNMSEQLQEIEKQNSELQQDNMYWIAIAMQQLKRIQNQTKEIKRLQELADKRKKELEEIKAKLDTTKES